MLQVIGELPEQQKCKRPRQEAKVLPALPISLEQASIGWRMRI